jgi:hypothetical protein
MATENLAKYEWAALASGLTGDKGRMPYALGAMSLLYKGFGMDKDPIVAEAIGRAGQGLKAGHITDAAFLKATDFYAKKYASELKEITVGEYISHVGFDIPEALKPVIEAYKDRKIGGLDKENEEDSRILAVISNLTNYRMEGSLYGKLVKESTKKNLEALAQSE